jgi:hypothetical protein
LGEIEIMNNAPVVLNALTAFSRIERKAKTILKNRKVILNSPRNLTL